MQPSKPLNQPPNLLQVDAQPLNSLPLHLFTNIQKAFDEFTIDKTHRLFFLTDGIFESTEFGKLYVAWCGDEGTEVRL